MAYVVYEPNETQEYAQLAQSQRPSAKSTEKNVVHCRVMYRTFNNMGNVHDYDIECSDIVNNHESLTLKQMFDVTAQLFNNQEEINCLDKMLFGKNSWTHLS